MVGNKIPFDSGKKESIKTAVEEGTLGKGQEKIIIIPLINMLYNDS